MENNKFSVEESEFISSHKKIIQLGDWQTFIDDLRDAIFHNKLTIKNSSKIINALVDLNIDFYSNLDRIPSSAFMNCTLPEKMQLRANKINNKSFYRAVNLKYLIAPSCTWVGEGAFAHARQLEKINLSSVTFVDKAAFAGCPSLTDIYMPKLENIDSRALMEWLNNREFINAKAVLTIPEYFRVDAVTEHKYFDNFQNDNFVIYYV